MRWMILLSASGALAWMMEQEAVALLMVAAPLVFLAFEGRTEPNAGSSERSASRPMSRSALTTILDEVLDACAAADRTTALLIVQVEDLHLAGGRWGIDAGGVAMQAVADRVCATLREGDAVLRTAEDGFAVVLAPTRHDDPDVALAVVDRLQAAIAEPIPLAAGTVRLRSCVGLCAAAMAPHPGGAALLAAGECALRFARRAGDQAVRAFNTDMQVRVETDRRLAAQVEDALRNGEIRPWFQPQIDASTGRVAGMETLARWHHPELGILEPAEFMPTLEAGGHLAKLGDVMLRTSLEALVGWDRSGTHVPRIGVNLSLEELSDPRLADRLIWQVDRFDVDPGRVAVEILETVTLRENDETIVGNIRALRDAGFRLDLDDFGTGAASISHIGRLGVHRIKIDRSFVHGLDRDPEQRKVVGAILGLARELGVEALAEGVETPGERAVLTEMGCPHLQGFGLARPMPRHAVAVWMREGRGGRVGCGLHDMAVHGTA
jgi:diguanylate cyclase (GGDEF)-like protein